MHKKPVWLLAAVLAVCLALPAAALDTTPDSVSAAPSAAVAESEVAQSEENILPDTEVSASSAAPEADAGSVAAASAAPSDSAPDTADSAAADLQADSVLTADSSVPDSTAAPTIWDKPFEEYTPAEGYLFLLFVLAVLAVFYKLFKGGVFYV